MREFKVGDYVRIITMDVYGIIVNKAPGYSSGATGGRAAWSIQYSELKPGQQFGSNPIDYYEHVLRHISKEEYESAQSSLKFQGLLG